MDLLHVPLAAAAALLVLSGPAKISRPAQTLRALRMSGLPATTVAVRALGAVEVVVGLGTLSFGGRWWSGATALLYMGFLVFVIVALWRNTPLTSCGCFGKASSPPSLIHVAINAGLAAVAAIASADRLSAPLDAASDAGTGVAMSAVVPAAALTWLLRYLLTHGFARRGSNPMEE